MTGLRQTITEREADVLRLLAAGKTRNEVADALSIANSTVDAHIRSVKLKTGAATRDQMMVRVAKEGLV